MENRIGPELLRGSLELMVLSALAGGPTYGYQLQQILRDASQELVQVQAGTLYPVLHRLEADGLIASRWDSETGRRRKWYELTRAGQGQLVTETQAWDRYVACLQRLLLPTRQKVVAPAT